MSGAGWSRVTHPFATLLAPEGAFSFDLHVLGTPPAFILSQDQTLRSKGGPFSGPPDQTDSVPVWKCCLSIRTAASEMRRIKINVKDRNDGSLSSTPMCPSEQLVGISQSTVCSLCVDSIRFSRSPRARGPPPRPAGINSRSVRRERVYYACLGTPSSINFKFFEIGSNRAGSPSPPQPGRRPRSCSARHCAQRDPGPGRTRAALPWGGLHRRCRR